MTTRQARLVTIFCALLLLGAGAVLIRAILALPEPPGTLVAMVDAHMSASEVTHPLTAVLLNFRGYDTLLEIAVLLLSALGALAIGQPSRGPHVIDLLDRPPVLLGLARVMTPVITVVTLYLLWVGSYRPGGAFQAGAVLGAGGVLLVLAGAIPVMRRAAALRLVLGLGLGVFTVAAIAPMPAHALLDYHTGHAKHWILAIETAAMISIGVTLTFLFMNLLTTNRPEA